MTNKTKTDFREFPESTYHLLEQVLGNEDRRLYSVTNHYSKDHLIVYENGRYLSVRIKEELVKIKPYEILSVSSVPAGLCAGSVLNLVFRNRETDELEEKGLFSFEEFLKGLEEILEKENAAKPRTKFNDRSEFDTYLRRFQGVEVDGVSVELTTEDSKKYNVLLGIFLEKKDRNTS